ncbi:MAG: hypothetical protein IH595_02960 [Bacteroidales bacterium]|nr:hypothetical protein [Bacteroidales bacterium]
MKRTYSLLNKALFLSLLLALPVMFYGQTNSNKNDEKKDVKKTQTTNFTPYFFLQGDFGISWPWADVATTKLVPDLRSNVFQVNGNLALGYQFNNWMNVYGNFTRGFVSGRLWSQKNTLYAPYYGKNLLFTADYYGPDLNVGFNLSNVFAGAKDRKFYVGAHVGLGQIQWKSKLVDQFNTSTVYAAYGYKDGLPVTQGKGISKRKIALDIPVGVDLNYKVNDTWTIYGDYTYRWLDTDLLDGGVVKGGNDAILSANIGARLNLNNAFAGSKAMANKFDQNVKLVGTPEPMVKKGKNIDIAIQGTVAPKYFNKKAVMVIQPVLTYEGGQKLLKPIVLKGEEVAGEGQLVSYANGGSFNYTASIPYEKGMEVATLHAAPVIFAYSGQNFDNAKDALAQGRKAVQVPDRKLLDGTIVTQDDLQVAPFGAMATTIAPVTPGNGLIYNFAPDGYQKVTVKTNISTIYFRKNIAKLEWGLKLNRNKENHDALENNLSNLQEGWAVKGVEIDGWASPEGEDSFNRNLSQDRANTAMKYLEAKIKRELRKKNNGFAFKSVKDVTVTTVANGPDWNGFMKAVQNSNIKDKSSIVNVVNSVPENQREAEIRKMIMVYPEIATEILPSLRRAVIKVNAFEPKRTDAEILQMATSSDYAKLSVPELLYAATLTNDLNTKVEIYKNLMTKEPSCWRAVANAGAVETAMGNTDEAKSLLMKAENMNPKSYEVENSLGILQAKMGNYDEAMKYFTKAQQLGADENYNLGVMNIAEGNYQQAVNLFNGYKCDYNVGLAQLLNGDYSAAGNTLQCTSESANSNYLLAVLNARQNNKSGMLNYLTKAIKMDSSLAAKAAKDREFIKFFDEPDFNALVNAK